VYDVEQAWPKDNSGHDFSDHSWLLESLKDFAKKPRCYQ